MEVDTHTRRIKQPSSTHLSAFQRLKRARPRCIRSENKTDRRASRRRRYVHPVPARLLLGGVGRARDDDHAANAAARALLRTPGALVSERDDRGAEREERPTRRVTLSARATVPRTILRGRVRGFARAYSQHVTRRVLMARWTLRGKWGRWIPLRGIAGRFSQQRYDSPERDSVCEKARV
ncbi:hypothetical protein HPB51_013202 [Rhipicephalus microplus]|uniref:Uncharacterized protein n=1 Tax=Rhipicephalus microplus TaxID=6941 RepID=A0A9J6DMU8_RHIMP|nr:hypothetical protein HPB51_013202 [Rhipicephalus microplus]